MFAYCSNTPVLGADPTGAYRVLQEDIDDEAIYHEEINGQGREPYASMKIGSSDLNQSGCGAIAVHNALLILGYTSDIRSWIDYFESKCYLRRLGVMPWEIDDALDHAGVSYIGSSDPSIVDNLKDGGVAIVTYWSETVTASVSPTPFSSPVSGSIPWIFGGAHTIAITHHDNSFWVYNSWNYATGVDSYGSIDYCTKGGTFIYGYYISP